MDQTRFPDASESADPDRFPDAEPLMEIWPDWKLTAPLDSGASGSVYLAVHRNHPEMQAAVKIISIPQEEEQTLLLRQEGLSDEQIRRRYAAEAEERMAAVRRMEQLKGLSHIVSMEDCKTLPRPDGPGYLICIRMELLKTLRQYLSDKTLREEEVIQLGMELSEALSVCHGNGILHMDLKPENIFVNDRLASGVLYKLGDFGVSRPLMDSREDRPIQGSMLYLPPEVSRRESPDVRSDLYMLGLVLYQLMNRNRLPFLEEKQIHTHADLQDTIRMRLNGIALPPPETASPEMAAVLLKACAFDPAGRYADAEELKAALAGLLRKEKKSSGERKKLRKRCGPALAAVLFLLLALVLSFPLWSRLGNPGPVPAPSPTPVPMIVVIDRTGGQP